MISEYRGYTIEHDRNHAHAWKGQQEQREPDVIGHDLADVTYKINIFCEAEERGPVTPV